MARTGRPPTPIEVKKKLGTARPDRMPSGSLELAAVPPVPRTLADERPIDAFDQVMAAGVSWLALTDAPALGMLRESLAERQSMLEGGYDRAQLRAINKEITEMLGQLGFNPAARARLGLAEVKAASKLEELRERAQRKQAKVVNKGHGG
jgi:hypothetical protein